MNPETTKIIEQYLSNELSPSDKIAFEKKLAESTSLQEEVMRQQNIHQAAKRAASRTQIQKIAKSYHLYKKAFTTGLIVAVVVVISSLAYLTYHFVNSTETDFSESKEVKALIEELSKNSPIENLASEFFFWTGQDSVMLSKEGVLLSVPKDAFLLNGKPYNDKAVIQWQEAIDPSTIVKSGLSTMAGNRLLETQGMFGIEAYTKDGKKLTVNPKVGIYVQAPVDQYKEGMQLFTGETGKDGIIDWTNPKPLQKIPVTVDMKELDFYPKGYEEKLDEMKMSQRKKYRDSLYLSFEETGNGEYLPEPVDSYTETVPDPNTTRSVILKNINLPNTSRRIAWNNTEIVKDYKSADPHPKNSWQFHVEYHENGYATIIAKSTVDLGWHMYTGRTRDGQLIFDGDGNLGSPISFKFNTNSSYTLIGNMGFEGELLFSQDQIGSYEICANTVIFKQKIKLLTGQSFNLSLICFYQIGSGPVSMVPTSIQKTIRMNTTEIKEETENIQLTHISPSKVMAFWQPAFNKTLLSTREFEKRMGTIHKTCDNKVLELYMANLSKSMQEIDEMAVSAGHPEFAEFVKEQVGALNPTNPHLKGLKDFYEREINKLKRIVAANSNHKQRKENTWDKDIQKGREKEQNRTSKREAKALTEEFNLNLKNVYEQLGISSRQLRNTVGYTLTNTGVYNIDKYVMDATVSRTSTVITDPNTGKIAKLTYNPFSFKVENQQDYETLYAYLFPSQLNSYQRISGSNGKFDYPLNDDIQYDLAIIGISDKGYFYKEQKALHKGSLGSLSLTELTEKQLNEKIKSLNESRGIIKPMGVIAELTRLVNEQKNYVEQKKRKEDTQFREKVREVVFPCYQVAVAADSTSVSLEPLGK